jgi:outer membrane protein
MQAIFQKSLHLFLVTVSCMSGLLVQAQNHSITVKQAIDLALANNYTLRADSLNIIMTGQKNKQVAAGYLPQANVASKFNYNAAIPNTMLPGAIAGQPSKDFVAIPFGTKYDAGTSFEVTQAIYRKDLALQIRAANLYNDIAQTKHALTREELVYQVAASFYGLQSNAELIRTTSKDYKNLKEILAIAKAQYENGMLKRIDYESLQINVANKQSQLDQYTTQYAEQLDYFKHLLGLPVTSALALSEELTLPALQPAQDNAQLSRRLDLHLYSQLIASKETDLKIIRAEKKPSINAYFKHNFQSQFSSASNMFDNNYWSHGTTFGISTSMPLFDGHRRRYRLGAAQTELQQLKWQSEEKQQRAQTELSTAWQKLNNNKRQFNTNTQNLVLAEKVFESRKALYAEGVSSLIELLDAEKELSQARNLHLQSMISVQTGQLEVHKANGTLLTEYLKSL